MYSEMTFIKTISKEEAQSPLKELYQEIEDTIAFKKRAFKFAGCFHI